MFSNSSILDFVRKFASQFLNLKSPSSLPAGALPILEITETGRFNLHSLGFKCLGGKDYETCTGFSAPPTWTSLKKEHGLALIDPQKVERVLILNDGGVAFTLALKPTVVGNDQRGYRGIIVHANRFIVAGSSHSYVPEATSTEARETAQVSALNDADEYLQKEFPSHRNALSYWRTQEWFCENLGVSELPKSFGGF